MARIGLNLKIDVSKIDKEKLFQGQKGTYLDMTVFVNGDADQYGNNGMIVQATTQEERAAGVQGAILGNARIFGRWDDSGQQQQPKPQASKPAPVAQQAAEAFNGAVVSDPEADQLSF